MRTTQLVRNQARAEVGCTGDVFHGQVVRVLADAVAWKKTVGIVLPETHRPEERPIVIDHPGVISAIEEAGHELFDDRIGKGLAPMSAESATSHDQSARFDNPASCSSAATP